MCRRSTMTTEEDMYYGSTTQETECSSVAILHMDQGRWGYGDQGMIDRYWSLTLRPLRNDSCNATNLHIYHMASVVSDNRESCTVSPHPELPLSHVLLCGEDGFYEWKPLPLPLSTLPVLYIGLGEGPCPASETRVPEDFDPTLPFRILQTRNFFYIGQGLSTRTIPRTHPNKPLTLSFRGLSFNVRFIESRLEEAR